LNHSIDEGFTVKPELIKRLLLKPLFGILMGAICTTTWPTEKSNTCAATKSPTIYLTLDTGHMGVANLIAEILQRQNVKATFFLANEPTQDGGTSLDERWAPWWKKMADQGHAFGSHMFDHAYWVADIKHDPQNINAPKFKIKASAGPQAGILKNWGEQQYCTELKRPAARFEAMTNHQYKMAKIFRAPGGRTSPALIAAAKRCGFSHVPWSAAGFLGDELPSARYPNAVLLQKALRDIKAGDILVAHLGIWSRQDPWAPAVLEPLIVGLKNKGFCFATLREHPSYQQAFD
jgi:peptidoglycan-N-acetylmuramic acid deacetylase